MTNTKGRYASLLGSSEAPSSEQNAESQVPDLPANPQTSKSANQLTEKSLRQDAGLSENQGSDLRTTPHVDKPTSHRTRKTEDTHSGKRGKKFTSYLPEESIRKIKWLAIERGVHDYEIVQEAIERYLSEQQFSTP